MKKIFIPCEKREATSRGFWKNPDGVFFRDFIRYELKEKLTNKILKEYCRTYKQEAIFFEAINNKSGRTNTGTCFFASGKKDVYNRKIKFYVSGINEAKKRIRELKNRGIEAYTIEKLSGKLEFVIFTWRNDTRKNRQKRILRRNNLIKKLIANLADGEKIRYRIQKNIQSGGRYNLYSNKVTISPYNIRHYRIKDGYKGAGDYYINRGSKINPYILHNYKNCLRFIILHEIGHAKFCKKYIGYKNFDIWAGKQKRHERFADAYALRQLKKRGVIC